MKSPMLRSALLVPFALLLLSCSQAVPRIGAASLRLVRLSGGVERLSFFALASDGDGLLDLEELHLLHDGAQLYWTLRAGEWLEIERSGETWIGSHALATADGEPFPRGAYRAVLADKSGSRAERTIAFDPPARSERPFPIISMDAGRYRIASAYPANSIVAYDRTGARVKTVALKTPEGRLSDLSLGSSVRSVALWAEDDESGVGALTDPVAVPEP